MVAGMRVILSIVYVATLNNIAPHAVMMMVWDKGHQCHYDSGNEHYSYKSVPSHYECKDSNDRLCSKIKGVKNK